MRSVLGLLAFATSFASACTAARPTELRQERVGALPTAMATSSPVVENAAAAPSVAGFGVVVEGACPELDLMTSAFENVTCVSYGHLGGFPDSAPSRLVLARSVTAGGVEEEPTMADGLSIDSANWDSISVSFRGRWPDRAFATLSVGNEMGQHADYQFARKGSRWEPVPETLDEHYGQLRFDGINGATLWLKVDMYPSFEVTPTGGAVPDFGALRAARRAGANPCFFKFEDLLVRPGGEVFLAGKYCSIFPEQTNPSSRTGSMIGRSAVARWAPGGRAKLEPIPSVPAPDTLDLDAFVVESPRSFFLFGRHNLNTAYLARYDGAAWSRIEVPYKGWISARRFDAEGNLWVFTEEKKLYQRTPAGEWKTVLDGVESVDFANNKPAWAIANKTLQRRESDGTWNRVPLPRPAFSASASFTPERVFTREGTTWIRASYKESRGEWSQPEERFALLRLDASTPSARATRCESAPAGDKSFLNGWPPLAADTCPTPLAILARASKTTPKGYDYPQTRAVVRGQAAAASARFMEFDIDGRKMFGAQVKDLASGRKLVELVGKGVPGTRPELVCAAPEARRTLPDDWAAPAK